MVVFAVTRGVRDPVGLIPAAAAYSGAAVLFSSFAMAEAHLSAAEGTRQKTGCRNCGG